MRNRRCSVPAIDEAANQTHGTTKAPVCIRLGDLSELFKAHCIRKGVSPHDEIRELISRALANSNAWTFRRSVKDERIRLALGLRKHDFDHWCKRQGLTASAAVKILIVHAVEQQIRDMDRCHAGTQMSAGETDRTPSPGQVVMGMQETEPSRLRIRLRPSELESLTKLAEKRHLSTQRLVTQILRAFLLKTTVFTQQESVDLGAINLSLMRIGTNLNQIARQLNAGVASQGHLPEAETTQYQALQLEIRRCVSQLDEQVRTCAHALQLSRERWRIELKD